MPRQLEKITARDILPTYVNAPRWSYYGTLIYQQPCFHIAYIASYRSVSVIKKLYLTPDDDIIMRLSTLLDEPTRIDLEGYTYLKG
jgi:hypothetical protein